MSTYTTKDKTLLDTLPLLAWIIFISVVIGVLVPYLTATLNIGKYGGVEKLFNSEWKPVLTKTDLKNILCSSDYATKLTNKQKNYRLIKCSTNRTRYILNINYDRKKFHSKSLMLRPYYGHHFVYIIPLANFGLLCILFVLPRWGDTNSFYDKRISYFLGSFRNPLVYSLILYIFLRLPNFWRNEIYITDLASPDEDRILFSFNHYDFSPSCFISIEINMILISILLVLIWFKWSFLLNQRRDKLKNQCKDKSEIIFVDYIADIKNVELFSRTFFEWQLASVFLGIAFLPFSKYYWQIYYEYEDKRFIFDAIFIHALWAFTWVIISLPLFITAYKWKMMRYKTLQSLNEQLSASTSLVLKPDQRGKDQYLGIDVITKEIEARLNLLPEILPVGFWNLTGSLVAAVIAVLWPILRTAWS
jgi:hypothetical protein